MNTDRPHLKVTLPTAMIVGVIIAIATFFSNIYTDRAHTANLTETVKSHDSQIKINTDRLTRVETRFNAFCDDLGSIKSDLKEIRRDQIEYYKGRGFFPKKGALE